MEFHSKTVGVETVGCVLQWNAYSKERFQDMVGLGGNYPGVELQRSLNLPKYLILLILGQFWQGKIATEKMCMLKCSLCTQSVSKELMFQNFKSFWSLIEPKTFK